MRIVAHTVKEAWWPLYHGTNKLLNLRDNSARAIPCSPLHIRSSSSEPSNLLQRWNKNTTLVNILNTAHSFVSMTASVTILILWLVTPQCSCSRSGGPGKSALGCLMAHWLWLNFVCCPRPLRQRKVNCAWPVLVTQCSLWFIRTFPSTAKNLKSPRHQTFPQVQVEMTGLHKPLFRFLLLEWFGFTMICEDENNSHDYY
jgi:hypothetical protein